MKKILLILLLISSFLFAEIPNYTIIDSKSNQEIDLKMMVDKLSGYDIIFFGEYHGNQVLHQMEFELLKMFHSDNKNLIVSMEMFERDVQPVLDRYLVNDISEEEFLQESRPWQNYSTDYKPLVEFAKANKLTVVAANIPRRYATMISKQGLNALDSLSLGERKYVAKRHKVFEDKYKESFIETMKNNLAHSSDMPTGKMMNFDQIYAAQCIKDDTMAESILKYQRIPPRRKVIHYNGEFHSSGHLGTAQKIKLLEPMLKIAVITPIIYEKEMNMSENDLLEGEFLILLMEEEMEEK